MKYSFLILLVAHLILGSCTTKKQDVLFEIMDAEHTNIHFINTITPNSEVNIIDFQYCYNGGGVGVGDFDNNGYPDLVFTGNQVSSRLYLNQGEFQFLDITEMSDFKTSSWVTGVSILDVNEDGWDDIYLNVGGANCSNDCPNLLFVNQGIDENGVPKFKEESEKYGLQESEYAQQTVFFDYDVDGDLDAFIVRNGNVNFDKNSPLPKKYFPQHLTDVLLQRDNNTNGEPVFKDVSQEMGIVHKGFGLGVGINDFNHDGLPDIYVGNDFITNDLIYVNQLGISKKPGFSNKAKDYMAHQTYNAMGIDVTDINNDLNPDVTVLDMLPPGYKRQKKMIGQMNYDKYQLGLLNDYTPQYMRNTIQLHNGTFNEEPLKFSDVSFMTSTAKTDWSWAPLWADYDGDGDKDLFITNGYGKDITDLDFINYTQQNNVYGTPASRDKKLKELIEGLPSVRLQNFFFENQSSLDIQDVTSKWVPEMPSLSNGAAYADLDLDGDLDLIVNNIDQKAFILKNSRSERDNFKYLNVKLKGTSKNKEGIGAKVILWSNGVAQMHYQSVVRGYLSSVEPGAFFGLKEAVVDSIQVIWPTGEVSFKKDIAPNQTITISIEGGKRQELKPQPSSKYFQSLDSLIAFKHIENSSNDFVYQNLLMNQLSKEGPSMASTELDGFQGEVLFIGGSYGHPGVLMANRGDGKYEIMQKLDSLYEDTEAVFFDFDNDGDKDLYVASGGSEIEANSEFYQDRMYINSDNAKFDLSLKTLPKFTTSTSCVRVNDYDKDGDLDIFVGSGHVPRKYPSTPKNRILVNNGGKFTEVGNDELEYIGMVKDAIWQDLDSDGWDDLIIVGDWMPITVFKNQSGILKKWSPNFSDASGNKIQTAGWWNCIKMGDFDNDGDADFLLGNQGNNNVINPSESFPMYIYNRDFDSNGSVDPVIGAFYSTEKGKELKSLNSRDDVMKQLVLLKNRFTSYDDFANTSYTDLLKIQDLDNETLSVTISESIYLENLGNFEFRVKVLPKEAQLGPIQDFLVKDFDEDGNLEALGVGNDFYAEATYGRYDALTGIYLSGQENDGFAIVPSAKSGFYVPGQSKALLELKVDNEKTVILAAQNNDSIKVFLSNRKYIDE